MKRHSVPPQHVLSNVGVVSGPTALGSVYPKKNDFVVAKASFHCKNLECFVSLRYFQILRG